MPPELPVSVRATHDIQRFRTVVVKQGATGIVRAVQRDSFGTSYTVEFKPAGLAGARITIQDLYVDDLRPVTASSEDRPPVESLKGNEWPPRVGQQQW